MVQQVEYNVDQLVAFQKLHQMCSLRKELMDNFGGPKPVAMNMEEQKRSKAVSLLELIATGGNIVDSMKSYIGILADSGLSDNTFSITDDVRQVVFDSLEEKGYQEFPDVSYAVYTCNFRPGFAGTK